MSPDPEIVKTLVVSSYVHVKFGPHVPLVWAKRLTLAARARRMVMTIFLIINAFIRYLTICPVAV